MDYYPSIFTLKEDSDYNKMTVMYNVRLESTFPGEISASMQRLHYVVVMSESEAATSLISRSASSLG